MKTGFLVEWLEQALTGALEAQKPKPEPPRHRFLGVADIERFARALGHRDVSVMRQADLRCFDMYATCRVGHVFHSEVDDLILKWARSDQAGALAKQLLCPKCVDSG